MTAKIELELQNLLPDLAETEAEADLEEGEEEEEEAYELLHYYDDEDNWHRLREMRGDMPGITHSNLIDYLKPVLRWMYRAEGFEVNREVNFYETDGFMEEPLYPDIFVFKTLVDFPPFRGYQIGKDGPAPQVAIEIISEATVRMDIGSLPSQKPNRYREWGVLEYYAYDPRPRKRKLKNPKPRLYGWRMVSGKYEALKADETGRMWSEQLDSWLVPDEEWMWLHDRDGNRRLTEAEARQLETEAAIREADFERQAKDMAVRENEFERQARNAAIQQTEAAIRQVDLEWVAKEAALLREASLQQELERMAEKLRLLEKGRNNL